MHILLIVSWYKKIENPVLGSFFEEQARALMEEGHQVGIICPIFKSFGDSTPDNSYSEIDKGLPVYYEEYKSAFPRLRAVNYQLFAKSIHRNAYKKYIQTYGSPNIIHTHSVFYAGIVASYISKKNNIAYVITEHSTPFSEGKITNKYDIFMYRKILEGSKRLIAVSEGFKSELKSSAKISRNIDVIHNMVNPIFFDKKKIYDRKEDQFTFYTVSFLTERKNHKLMIDAFELFHSKNGNSKFIIGGDGPIKAEIENYIKIKGLENSVILRGPQTRTEVFNEMTNAHVFLLASHYETFGVVLIEALATGRPVISTDSVGPRDIIINHFNGILLKSWDSESFSNAMLSVFENYKDYDPQKISKDCLNRFGQKTIIKKIIDAYYQTI